MATRISAARIVTFVCVLMLMSFLLLFVTVVGNMAGTGETVTEGWVISSVYAAIVGLTGFFCLSLAPNRRRLPHLIAWITGPLVAALLVACVVLSTSVYTAARAGILAKAAVCVLLGGATVCAAAALLGRLLRKARPNQPSEPTTMAVTPPAGQESRQP